MYNKQIYVSPLTIRRTIEIESCLMAASKEVIKDEKIEVTIEKQAKDLDFDFTITDWD